MFGELESVLDLNTRASLQVSVLFVCYTKQMKADDRLAIKTKDWSAVGRAPVCFVDVVLRL